MGEVGKGRMDIKKLKYEKPRLVKLNGGEGAGEPDPECAPGSGALDCTTGNSPSVGCSAGNADE